MRSADAFTLRRSQVLSAGTGGRTPAAVARALGCTARSARNPAHAFAAEGVGCLAEKSSRPEAARPVPDATREEPLRHLPHQAPRAFGPPRSTWTLAGVARACHAKGWTPRVLSLETVRRATARPGVSRRRAGHWIASPDPAYARKKKPGAGRSGWPPRTPGGASGFRTSGGGAGGPGPTRTPGPRPRRCAWPDWPLAGATRVRRPWPVPGCSGPTPGGWCSGSWTVGR